jgi:hypothetical protein
VTVIKPRIVWAGLTEHIHNFDEKTSMQQTSRGPMLRQVGVEMDNNMNFREKKCSCIGLNWSRLRSKAGFSITPVVLIFLSFFWGGGGGG